MAGYLDQALEKIREFEGSVPWMYLDTVGKVTVGVGLMLGNEIAALSLPFVVGDQPAGLDQIGREFARVRAMKSGRAAKFYVSKLGLYLPDDAIDAKLRDTIRGFESYLRLHISGYEALPDTAKLALLDMVYNLGPGRLFAEYPHLIAAVERGDWRAAAASSLRRGPSSERNAWVKQQFLAAASVVQLKAEGREAFSGLLLGLMTGIAAAAAVTILSGVMDTLAAGIRSRQSA